LAYIINAVQKDVFMVMYRKALSLIYFLATFSLAEDVIFIDFDDLQPTETYTKDQLIADFAANYGKGFYEGGADGSNRAAIDATQSVNGSGNSLRIRFPAGQLKTDDSGVDTRIPLAGTASNNTFAADELYFSYWIKFSDNFEFERCGGKLPSLGGADSLARTNQWKGRIMWRAGGSIQFYMELPHGDDGIDADSLRFWGDKEFDGGSICENRFTSYLTSTKWHNIELRYKLNTSGENDGLFEGWVDGGVGHKVVSSEVFGNYRPADGAQDKLTINSILISAFLGGSSDEYRMAEDTYIWIDDLRVSTERINEYFKYPQGEPPSSIQPSMAVPKSDMFQSTENYYNALGQRERKVKSVFASPVYSNTKSNVSK